MRGEAVSRAPFFLLASMRTCGPSATTAALTESKTQMTDRLESSATPKPRHALLTGWGRYPLSESDIYRPEKIAELQAVVTADATSLIARGAGRAYGDAALNDQNRVVDLTRLNRMLAFDAATGILRCEAGVTIAELIDVFMPRGFFPPVTPGTRFVTLGGSIAADVHGKNHHRDSSLASHVTSFDLMIASGEVLRCSREENAELFRATVGGMGLTGVILELELRMRRVESAYLDGELIRAGNIDAAIEAFERADAEWGYSVAWIDCNSGKGALGRSVLNVGNFATLDRLPRNLAQDPLVTRPRRSPSSTTKVFSTRSIRSGTGIESMANAASCSINACGRPPRAARAWSKCSRRSAAAGADRFSPYSKSSARRTACFPSRCPAIRSHSTSRWRTDC